MRELNVNPYKIKFLLGYFLLHVRQREVGLTRKMVAEKTRMSVRTLNNLENTSFVSGDLILRIFHYYMFLGYVSIAEKRLFFYLFDLMKR